MCSPINTCGTRDRNLVLTLVDRPDTFSKAKHFSPNRKNPASCGTPRIIPCGATRKPRGVESRSPARLFVPDTVILVGLKSLSRSVGCVGTRSLYSKPAFPGRRTYCSSARGSTDCRVPLGWWRLPCDRHGEATKGHGYVEDSLQAHDLLPLRGPVCKANMATHHG